MLCDRDSAPIGFPGEDKDTQSHLRVLNRCHLENYFLDEEIWAKAFAPLEPTGHWLRDPAAIRARFRAIGVGLLSYAAAVAVAAEVRLQAGNIDTLPKNCHDLGPDELSVLFASRVNEEQARMASTLDAGRIDQLVRARYDQLAQSLEVDTEYWKEAVPGKPLLRGFAGAAGMHYGRLKNLYLATAAGHDHDPFSEVDEIFRLFANS
jgi:hypothetical protein